MQGDKWERKQMLRRKKEEIYLMQRPCKSGVPMNLKQQFVTMAILGYRDGINKKTHQLHGLIIIQSACFSTVIAVDY